ncbi:MAG: hypothetical protein COW24_01310 [Candidatus Kerfeldbacteria bacterium CG15_BIG_FIL_POST_REV_8_21_14_020_45_12]|uniref:DUF4012 domain-containing protein n=1 Tax=Candidatus Kerfeldbacteria bacterium CG15_BIG_FIL_POST_REV_8_21_14_020_45_12 TaxID=2014247 RepID=A0A2M7H4T1_9BACT|nr:MAG: hypothetical protein COW24_01310 [Candidatus Kerfeldbacteria bacterium CG15_BIG_FIL_POST_REV_8_21_14_020_45_12]PJA93571.1 MAG: hypothetical protein CO132_02435 [Candidatus Kerfeldbacteria bacterium CG_4_9_14_3_um_filter_45_8]
MAKHQNNKAKQKPNVEAIQIALGSSSDHGPVPKGNIIDLRSIVAKREASARDLRQSLAPELAESKKRNWWQRAFTKVNSEPEQVNISSVNEFQPAPAPVLESVADSPVFQKAKAKAVVVTPVTETLPAITIVDSNQSAESKKSWLASMLKERAVKKELRDIEQERAFKERQTNRELKQLEKKERRLQRGVALLESRAKASQVSELVPAVRSKRVSRLANSQSNQLKTAAIIKDASETAKKAATLYHATATDAAITGIDELLPSLTSAAEVGEVPVSRVTLKKTTKTPGRLRASLQSRWNHIAIQYGEERSERLKAKSEWKQSVDDNGLTNEEWENLDSSQLPFFGFSWKGVLKPLSAFAIVSLLVVVPATVQATRQPSVPLEDRVAQAAEQAFLHLQKAGDDMKALDFAGAEAEFGLANDSFAEAQQQVGTIHDSIIEVAKYIPGKPQQLYTGAELIEAGADLSAAGEQLAAAMQVLSTVDVSAVAKDEDTGLTSILLVVHSALDPTVSHLASAIEHLNNVNPSSVPSERRDLVVAAQETLPDIYEAVDQGLGVTELLLSFLGHESEKSYLVLFQNNYEMRPSGGFIGTIAAINVKQGVVTGLNIPGGGVYDVSGQVKAAILPPEPLLLVADSWNLQDSNWFAHFPTSAKKAEEFYTLGGGEAVDGVIALVPSVVERMLDVTGPIDLSRQHGVVIDKTNFYSIVQTKAEEKFDETRESKQIIADMTPLLFSQLFATAEDPDGLMRILSIVRTSLEEKDMLVFMNDSEIQKKFTGQDWSGELKYTDRDYLNVVHANIAGGKTDGVVEEAISHTANIQSDGSVIDNVTLTRVHKGKSGDLFTGVNNSEYIRFYIPEGSQLISVSGFDKIDPALFKEPAADAEADAELVRISGEITHDKDRNVDFNVEYNKQVIGGWVVTSPGESSTVSLEYRLPFTLVNDQLWSSADHYSLLVQKQPGSFGDFLSTTIKLPDNMKSIEYYPESFTGSADVVLSEDYFTGVVLQQAP